MAKVCPYCGKRFETDDPPNSVDDSQEDADDFDGVTLSQPGDIHASSKREVHSPQTTIIEVEEMDEESDSSFEILDSSASSEPKERPRESVSETYDTADDYEPNALELTDPADGPEEQEELPELMFRPPQESDTGIRRMTETLPNRENISEDFYQPSGRVGPRLEKKNWDDYPERIIPGEHVPVRPTPDMSQVKEISQKIIPKKPSNALAGFIAIVLALFMITKGGAWLLNWFKLFNGDLYTIFVTPWLERIEIGLMIFVVWIIAAVSRPVSLKILSLLFAFAATIVYGLVVYLRFFS
jgi:hypothetical protein